MSAVRFVCCHTFRFQCFQLPSGMARLVHGFRVCLVQRHEMRGLRGRIETCFVAFLCYRHTVRHALLFFVFLGGVAGGLSGFVRGGWGKHESVSRGCFRMLKGVNL